MPNFSDQSRTRLMTCDIRLQILFEAIIENYDCTVLCGHRGEAEQNEAFRTGKSKLDWPASKHNTYPSLAVDVAPYPIDWADKQRFVLFAGYVQGVADAHDIPIRWGGDFNQDRKFNDGFVDMPHFELVDR